jgi:hypothetical protein
MTEQGTSSKFLKKNFNQTQTGLSKENTHASLTEIFFRMFENQMPATVMALSKAVILAINERGLTIYF